MFNRGDGDMPASRRRKTPSRHLGPAAAAATAGPLEDRIKEEVTAGMKQRLGLPEGEKIPVPVQDLVDSAARDAAENTIEIAVIREVEKATTRMARGSPGARSESPANVSDVPLMQDAEDLAARKKALEAAGFSSDESMRILIAEVTAGHRQTRSS